MGVNTAIRHVVNGKVVISVYGHMQRGSLRFGVGQRVKVGQRIGRVGNTGSSTGAHLHFEIRTASGRAINPLTWLRKNLHR
jgi:murein DD-endopeptidase MepM/ murein hydrolase activator NlpD